MKKYLFTLLTLLISMSSFAQSLTDSLKAYYDFSGNAQDQSGYGHHGTVFNAVLAPDRFGNANSAYYFDGANDYIEILSSAQMRPTTFPVSISTWVKIDPTYTLPNIIFTSDNNSDGNDYGFWLNLTLNANEPLVSYGNGGPCAPSSRRSKVGTSSLNDNQWHLIVAVIRGPTDMDLYVDCQNDGGSYQGTGTGLVYSGLNLAKIAHFHCATYDYYFKGSIDEVRFYHRELTQVDVTALYTYPFPSLNMAANILGSNQYLCPGQTISLDATTSWASSYLWSDGTSGPTLNITQPGVYSVDIAGGDCGEYGRDTLVVRPWNDIDIIADTTICKAQNLVLDVGSGYVSYSWSTGATTQSINISNSGTYYVNLSTATGCSLVDTIQVLSGNILPNVNFTYTFQNGNMIQFSNTSNSANSYQWYFDGVLDTTANPLHYFPCNIPMQVMLIGANECGNDTSIQNVVFNCDGIDALNQNVGIKISPIPAQNVLHLEYELYEKTNVSINIYDEVGRKIQSTPSEWQNGEVKTEISVANLPNGVYLLHFVTEEGSVMKKVMVFR